MRFLGQLDLFHLLLSSGSRPLAPRALAEVMDALAWHPYVGLDLQDAAAALTLIGRADPELGQQMRRLAADALALGAGDEISAARAALVGRTLEALLAGTPPASLAPGWEVGLLAGSWLERGIGDRERLCAILADLEEERER